MRSFRDPEQLAVHQYPSCEIMTKAVPAVVFHRPVYTPLVRASTLVPCANATIGGGRDTLAVTAFERAGGDR